MQAACAHLRRNGDLINGEGYPERNTVPTCRKCNLEKSIFGVGGLSEGEESE